MTDRLPLSALLSQAIAALNADFQQAGAGSGRTPSLAVWSNVLQYLDEEGSDVRGLKTRSCLSTRALTVALGRLEKRGLLAIEKVQRKKIVSLTAEGKDAVDAFPPLINHVEKGWRHKKLRKSLEGVVAQLELDHPHYPSQYGTADPRVTGGPGQDWSPVPRTDRDDVRTIPLSALLSQALMAFAIEYEQRNGPLGWSANVLRFVNKGGLLVHDLPPTSVAIGTMERHGAIKIAPGARKDTKIVLTPLGKRLKQRSGEVLASIEQEWRGKFGAALVDDLRASLEALNLSDDLPHYPRTDLVWTVLAS